jgi:hypothetical protein
MRAARASGSPRAVSLIVFAMIRSTVALSHSDIPFSSFQCANIGPHPSVAHRGLAGFGKPPYLREMMLDLTEEETDALAPLLRRIIDDDRYPLSPRIQTLKAILAKLRPEPACEPLPPPKAYGPPRTVSARRRRAGR